jgi:Xaa-Pro aminopeptidase
MRIGEAHYFPYQNWVDIDMLSAGHNSSPIKTGMTVSNGIVMCFIMTLASLIIMVLPEPGYYADGRFGIRIENIVLAREAKTPNNFGEKGYIGFEHVTMVKASNTLFCEFGF